MYERLLCVSVSKILFSNFLACDYPLQRGGCHPSGSNQVLVYTEKNILPICKCDALNGHFPAAISALALREQFIKCGYTQTHLLLNSSTALSENALNA